MRARNLKPSIFRNELLAVADPLYTLVFQGLWCLADRAGRLEDRPAKIHLEINPGRAYETTTTAIAWLSDHGFIQRYEAAGARYIVVVNFAKHQNPHVREPESTLPAPCKHSAGTVPDSGENSSGPADSGFPLPPSGLPLPDSPIPRKSARLIGRPIVLHESLPRAEWGEWIEFRRTKRWPNDPTTLGKQLKLLAQFEPDVQRQMLDTSIQAGWQGLFPPKRAAGVNGPPAAKPRPRLMTPEEIEAEEAARATG